MENKKVFSIVINGIQESISAVESLNKQLDALESRIKELDSKNINVATSSSGKKGLSEEVAMQKQLNQLKKEEAAQQRLIEDAYANSMKGMKQNLADLKTMINATDLGDSDAIEKMTKDAGELTQKLKEMEEAYGQFGRNVGNYKSAADGFNKYKITVGGVTREFNTAKEAARTLSNELLNLPKGAKGAEDLRAALQQVKSEIQDIGKSSVAMDNLLDTMEGIVAVANVGQGIRGLFGVDDAEMQKSIKNLVALQNVLKGIETINKQINTKEGIGAWIAPFNTQIDKATTKLLTFNTALLGTSKAAKVAEVGIKAFGKALKIAISFGVLLVVDALVEKLMDLIETFKKVDYAAETTKKVNEQVAKSYGDAASKLAMYQARVQSFNGTKAQEKKLVEELNKEFGNTLGTYKSLSKWKEVLIKQSAVYAQSLAKEAKVQAYATAMAEALANAEKARYNKNGVDWYKWQQIADGLQSKMERAIDDLVKFQKDNGLGNFAPQIEKNTDKTKDAIESEQKTLAQLELRLMKEGLNKKLRQLDEEERQTIASLQKNGRKSADAIKKVQASYVKLRENEIKAYLKNIEYTIAKSAQDIKNIQFEIDIKDIDIELDRLKNKFDELSNNVPLINTLTTKLDLDMLMDNEDKALRDYGKLMTSLYKYSEESTNSILKASFDVRLGDAEDYYKNVTKALRENIKEQSKLNEQRIKDQYEQDTDAERERYRLLYNEKSERLKELNDEIAKIKGKNDDEVKLLEKLKSDKKVLEEQMEDDLRQHGEKMGQLTESMNNAIKKNEIDTYNEISSVQEKYYDFQISNYRDFQSKLNDEISRNPVTIKDWGIVNISQTKRNYEEIIKASKEVLKAIDKDKQKLEEDFKNGLISKEAYNTTKNALNDFEKEIKNGMTVTDAATKSIIADFVSSINQYLQAVMDSFSTIMSAVWDAEDTAFDKEQEELDKQTDAISDALDKQQDIVQKHKDAINGIEDELATARGDRRQHLIDQLNAEIAAQRAAAKEEEKLTKQKEAQERKQEELDKKRKKAEYERSIIQAIVNGAQAVTMAAINTWPVPAIPMMALAASTVAAQIAIMKANKPYAKGGLLEGASHKEGGIPVGNTGIEVEGKEYIIRKESTTPNVEILDYINQKKRKLTLDDFIEFYSGKAKKSVMSSSPRARFADGGVIPTLSNDYSFDDRLLNAFEDYAKRPVYVSVVDINNRQAAVKNVQVLAGLGE